MDYSKFRENALKSRVKEAEFDNYNLTENFMEDMQIINKIEGDGDQINEEFIVFVLKKIDFYTDNENIPEDELNIDVKNISVFGNELILNIGKNEIKFVKNQLHTPTIMLFQGYTLIDSIQKSHLEISDYFVMGNYYITADEFRSLYEKAAENVAERCCEKRYQSLLNHEEIKSFDKCFDEIQEEDKEIEM